MSVRDLTTRGRCWRLGDLVNIDEICATRYLMQSREVWAERTFELLIPNFRERAQPGDVVVAGAGFAYGGGGVLCGGQVAVDDHDGAGALAGQLDGGGPIERVVAEAE